MDSLSELVGKGCRVLFVDSAPHSIRRRADQCLFLAIDNGMVKLQHRWSYKTPPDWVSLRLIDSIAFDEHYDKLLAECGFNNL